MTQGQTNTILGRSISPSAQVEKILVDTGQNPKASYSHLSKTVLFTDIVGSTAYFESHGDDRGMAMIERHNQLLFPMVERNDGRIIKTIGDAIMACFDQSADAVKAAVMMQYKLKEHNKACGANDRIRIRIGINHGEVIERDGDLYGDVVNAAARVEALARGDQILISAAVEDQLGDDFLVERAMYDAFHVKGKEEPLRVLEVIWDKEAKKAAHDPSQGLAIGTKLGNRYEIMQVLGEGGMGMVYRALDHALDEEVALKFLRADLAQDQTIVNRFKSEVRLARSITHPNICRIHEFQRKDRHIFISMELVRGPTLDQLVKECILDKAGFMNVVEGICHGLNAAHERGITHRDLKPANVMIERDTNRVVLMDFGIAQTANGRRATEAGLMIGTPEYMSPEQVRGEVASPVSDVYALGVIMYELLSGKLPLEGDNPMLTAVKQLNEEPRPLAELQPNLPPRVTDVVGRCLAKDPIERFANTLDLLKQLKQKRKPKRSPLDEPLIMPPADDGPTIVMQPDDEDPTTILPPDDDGPTLVVLPEEQAAFAISDTDEMPKSAQPRSTSVMKNREKKPVAPPPKPVNQSITSGSQADSSPQSKKPLTWVLVLVIVGALAVVGFVTYGLLFAKPEALTIAGQGGTTQPAGYLTISSAGPVKVMIDGKLQKGDRPTKMLLPVGKHWVKVSDQNGKTLADETFVLTERAHKVIAVSLPLRPKPSSKKKKKSSRKHSP